MYNGVLTSLLSAYSDSRTMHYANSICKECPSRFNSAICASSIRIYSELWVLRYTGNRFSSSFEATVEIMDENLVLIKWKLVRDERISSDSFKNAHYRNRTFIVTRTSSSATSSLAKALVLARTAWTCAVAFSELCVAKVLAAGL